MTTVTGYTATRMKAIEDNAITGASLVGTHLLLVRNNGTTIDVGNVQGLQGVQGIQGTPGTAGAPGASGFVVVADQTARLALTGVPQGQSVYEQSTERVWRWSGSAWRWIVGTGSSPYLVEASASTTQAVGAGATVDVAFGTETTDRANAFSTPTFTAPVAGCYRVWGTVRTMASAAGTWNPTADLIINGVQNRFNEAFFTAAANGVIVLPYFWEGNLLINQTVKLQHFSGGVAATIQSLPNSLGTRIGIDLIGY